MPVDVTIREKDICHVKLTEYGNEIYSEFCKKAQDRCEKGYWLFQCPEPKFVASLHWLMLIFGKHLDPDMGKRVFQDGIHLH
jgi:hypothetical protein